jgi:site-specific DNA-methyltransferase (adenine-specific)
VHYTEFPDGLVVCGTFPDEDVLLAIELTAGRVPLVCCDPPYGNIVDKAWDKVGTDDRAFAAWMIDWTRKLEPLMLPNSALYAWGGIGKVKFRPFYRYLIDVEHETNFRLANHITWSKKRAYGVQHNYLFTREELAYLILGEDIKKPRCFNVPLLDQKRGYAGYDAEHPAKSEFFRRTNVWSETEVLRGKLHINQKAARVVEIPIEVHTQPGEWVLDLFSGSGETSYAARKLGRKFIAVENDPIEYAKICERLRI